jgi:hypothetical protein
MSNEKNQPTPDESFRPMNEEEQSQVKGGASPAHNGFDFCTKLKTNLQKYQICLQVSAKCKQIVDTPALYDTCMRSKGYN